MSKRIELWVLLLAAIILSRLTGMWLLPFIDTTEPRYAEIARLMAESGDWITPWFEPGVPFWGKPPLSFWAQAAAIRIFGDSELAIRMPSMLALLLTVWIFWRYAVIKSGKTTARLAVLVFMTMTLPFVSAGAVMTDPFLLLGTTMSLIGYDLATHDRKRSGNSLFFSGMVIGLLAKGPLAIVLIAIPIVGYCLPNRQRWHALKQLEWIKGLAVVAALVLPWYVAAEIKTPGFIDYFIVGEHFLRFIDAGWSGDLYGSAHDQAKGMIWIFWVWASFPWGIFILLRLIKSISKQGIGSYLLAIRKDAELQYLLLAALSPMLFFSLAGNTLWTYVLPSLPFSGLLIARALTSSEHAMSSETVQPGQPHGLAVKIATLMVPVVVTAGVISVDIGLIPVNSQKALVAEYHQAASEHDSPLFFADGLPFSARFYSRGTATEVSKEQVIGMLNEPVYRRYFVAVPIRDSSMTNLISGATIQTQGKNEKFQLLLITPVATNYDKSS